MYYQRNSKYTLKQGPARPGAPHPGSASRPCWCAWRWPSSPRLQKGDCPQETRTSAHLGSIRQQYGHAHGLRSSRVASSRGSHIECLVGRWARALTSRSLRSWCRPIHTYMSYTIRVEWYSNTSVMLIGCILVVRSEGSQAWCRDVWHASDGSSWEPWTGHRCTYTYIRVYRYSSFVYYVHKVILILGSPIVRELGQLCEVLIQLSSWGELQYHVYPPLVMEIAVHSQDILMSNTHAISKRHLRRGWSYLPQMVLYFNFSSQLVLHAGGGQILLIYTLYSTYKLARPFSSEIHWTILPSA